MKLGIERVTGGYRFFTDVKAGSDAGSWISSKLTLEDGANVDASALVDLAARDLVEVLPDQSIKVADKELAQFSSHDIMSLGLPPVAHLTLAIRTEGAITSADFSLDYSLSDQQGRRWLGIRRDGVLLTRAGNQFTIIDPVYSILERLDTFSSIPADHQSRFSAWAEIQQLLPDDVSLDGQLASLTIYSSDCISLELKGNCDFDPIPLSSPGDQDHDVGAEPVVPEYYLDTFKQQFRRFNSAHKTYALGAGHYLMFPEKAHAALKVVRSFQQKPESERRTFAANPQKYFAADMATPSSDDVQSTEEPTVEVFIETQQFLSGRIKELGQWSPKIGAFVMASGTDWLPAEEIEIFFSVGKMTYKTNLGDLAKLEERIHQAEQQGQDTIIIGEHNVPITDELKSEAARFRKKAGELIDERNAAHPRKVQVPVLFDNIESLGFEAQPTAPRTGEFRLPEALKTKSLYDHQKSGLQWLFDHWSVGSPGALLADDMGLGKTLQTLAFLAWVQESKIEQRLPLKPHLIIAPTGLLKNWMDEVKIHLQAKGLGDLVQVFGSETSRLRTLSPRERKQKLSAAGWVLTTYETMRDQILWFIDVPWSVVTFDEAQKIKNPAARVTEMAKSLQAEFTLLLTGTPVENSLADLWCIMDAAHPGLLGSQRDFVREYVQSDEVLTKAQELKAKLQDENPPAPMLRRLKEDHLTGLPSKGVEVRERLMSESQMRAYDQAVVIARGTEGKNSILEAIQKLKSASLIGRSVDDAGLDQAAIDSSARLQETLLILDELYKKGEKALIFLESIELQKRLVPYLQHRYNLPDPPLRISGEINGMLRKGFVDRFQAIPAGQFAVMILSPKAGGVGLTLTAANHVIHLSRWWNPAVEDQCTDRVYRIGQHRPVTVWYPIATHPEYGEKSFDWNLHRLLEKKRTLSRSALIGQVDARDMEELLGESIAV